MSEIIKMVGETTNTEPAKVDAAKAETVESLMSKLDEKCSLVADAMNNGVSGDELKALKDAAKGALDAYNRRITSDYYTRIATEGDAIKTALSARYIPGVQRVKYAVNKKTGRAEYSISENPMAKADLYDMQKTIGVQHFADAGWNARTQKMAFIMANAINKNLGNSLGFKYIVSEAAMAFGFATDADPTSKASGVKALQQCVDGIIYIEGEDSKGNKVNRLKVETRHYAYIRECMTRQGNDSKSVLVGGTTKMDELVADVIHQILTKAAIKAALME